jgi:hypothetical protein
MLDRHQTKQQQKHCFAHREPWHWAATALAQQELTLVLHLCTEGNLPAAKSCKQKIVRAYLD